MRKIWEKIIFISFILPILLLGSGIILSAATFSKSYAKVDRYTAKYPDNDQPIIGNVYYPKHSSYSAPPVVLYIHGFMMQKDMDARVPMEFCRRGFVVLSVDLHGHGEADGVFGPKAYQDGKDAIEYVFDYLSVTVNTSLLAVVGHSAGGLTALGLNDSRIGATVTWASPVYYSEELIERFKDNFALYNPDLDTSNQTLIEEFNSTSPYNYLNETNPQNLLAIHHVDDPIVNVTHAYEIHNKTQCELIILNDSICENRVFSRMAEYPHSVLYDCVMATTINWIEQSLGLSSIPVTEDYKYWSRTFSLGLILSVIGLFATAFSAIFYFSKTVGSDTTIPIKFRSLGIKVLEKYKLDRNSKLKQLVPFLGIPVLLFIGFLISQIINTNILRFRMNLTYLIPSILLASVSILYILMVKQRVNLDVKGLIFGIVVAIVSLGSFVLFTFGFRSFILYPHNLMNVLYGTIFISIWIGVSYFVMWKIWIYLFPDFVFEPLIRFSESIRTFLHVRIFKKTDRKNPSTSNQVFKIRWKIVVIVLTQFAFYSLVLSAAPLTINTLAVNILQLLGCFMCGWYYYFRRNITGIAILNGLILIFFYSTCYWFFPNFP